MTMLKSKLMEFFSSFTEPGYYKENDFGIRIEDIALTRPIKTEVSEAHRRLTVT